MGLFGRGKKTTEEAPVVECTGPGLFAIDVVGESHYQNDLEKICGGRTEKGHKFETQAYLFHEDDNPHDNKAIVVVIDGMIVGYLDRQNAREIRKLLAAAGFAGHPATCAALIVGGWDRGKSDKGHFGVKLDLAG